MTQTKNPSLNQEFINDCKNYMAEFITTQSESLELEKRIMLFHALAELFPKDSQQHLNAKSLAHKLNKAEKAQLKFKSVIGESQLNPRHAEPLSTPF